MDKTGKTKLSKHLMEMKFMRRSSNLDIIETAGFEQRQSVDDEHWVIDLPELTQKESQYQIEASHVPCAKIKSFGRMSFMGMNPQVEKLMKVYDQELSLEIADEREREIAVDDKEMADRYDSLIGTISKKFQNKRHRSEDQNNSNSGHSAKRQKKEFKKPKED